MLRIDSDVERIKDFVTKIHGAFLELPNWTKTTMITLVALSAINSIVGLGESLDRAIYYFSH